jgi:uncharacterized protein YcnI
VRLLRTSATCLLGVLLALTWAQVASAHVTVNPSTASPGGYAKLTFRVPNEQDSANTTKLEVQLPPDAPLASVSVQPHAGWTYTTSKRGESVSTVTWSGGSIAPGEFDEFSISVGPLPKDKPSLVFKALQTYDNGEVVSWIETANGTGAELEHPAPVLTLSAPTTATVANDDDDDSNALALVALVVGGVGVAIGLVALILNRKREST